MTIGLAQPSSLSTPNNSPSPIQTVVIRPRPLPVRSTPTAPVCPLNHHHGPTLFVARINLAMTDSAPTSSQISYVPYDPAQEATQLESVRELISSELSEPYSIYVYRYFLYQWGDLCYLAVDSGQLIGVVISKLEVHRGAALRGYIAMLAVRHQYRGRGIATKLVQLVIEAMVARNADEIALETEVTNVAAIKLYEGLGFLRSKHLHRYYLNGNSAFRLVLYLRPSNEGHHCEHNQGEEGLNSEKLHQGCSVADIY
ncbi:acyl-CoA N-acyltransferase [Ascodesmis nigricans]|uniref:Acyl-CoA N-acyltransferase n=1 Tax=Ascodesmis nigricans TaxID=341454 RepID=A0A4S2MUM4_9PEZI|nr:acyl-CoA N-acyltransferase [Ascodesmis nigricans]